MSRYILCDNCQIYDTLEDCVVQDFEVLLNRQDEKIKELKQLQNQKAIEELEKLRKENFEGKCKWFCDEVRQILTIDERDKSIVDYIDQRIKELKGETK